MHHLTVIKIDGSDFRLGLILNIALTYIESQHMIRFANLMINLQANIQNIVLPNSLSTQHMQRPLQFILQSQLVNDKSWKNYMRQFLAQQNAVKKILIIDRFWGGPDFNEVGPFWGSTDFNEVVAQICESDINPNLYEFIFALGRISLNSFRRITSFLSNNCRFLTSLCLSYTGIGDESVSFIVKAEWRYIAKFGFSANNITFKGVKQFHGCKWKYINQIVFADNPLKNAGVQQLIRLDWRGLMRLSLINVGLTDDGVKILARAEWPKLLYLNLNKNQFTHQAVSYILYANWNKLIQIMFNRYQDERNSRGNLESLERKTNQDFISFGSDQWID